MISNNYILVKQFHDVFKKKNYAWFEGPHNCNIVGVRSNSRKPDRFDDRLYYIAQDSSRNWFVKSYEITTDPGLPQLLNPSNPKGVAILKPGQYRGAYKIGFHRGRYQALVQQGGEVEVYRDSDRDAEHDFENMPVDKGYFGINIHKAGINSVQVGQWSAGCQVFANEAQFSGFMHYCKSSVEKYGNSFTYTLLEEKDFV